jgi:hypothetical protein
MNPLSNAIPVKDSRASLNRSTPRRSLIVVIGEGQGLAPGVISERLITAREEADVDVILACAGPLDRVAAIRELVRDARVLVAPPGTSSEDLRELAIEQAPGDIVTLLSGGHV